MCGFGHLGCRIVGFYSLSFGVLGFRVQELCAWKGSVMSVDLRVSLEDFHRGCRALRDYRSATCRVQGLALEFGFGSWCSSAISAFRCLRRIHCLGAQGESLCHSRHSGYRLDGHGRNTNMPSASVPRLVIICNFGNKQRRVLTLNSHNRTREPFEIRDSSLANRTAEGQDQHLPGALGSHLQKI